MKNKNTLIIVGVVVLAILIFAIYKYRSVLFASSTGEVNKTPITGQQPDVTIVSAVFPLKNGSHGNEVLNLQKAFNRTASTYGPVALLVEDGIFGPKTELAVTLMLQGKKEVSKEDYVKYVLPAVS